MTTILVSAICPVRNEEENIVFLFKNLRKITGPTEVIFVEGGSSDNSWKRAQELDGKTNKFGVQFRAVKQIGKGKAEAVATGSNQAKGKYLLIVDADLSVSQKDLEKLIKLFSTYGDAILASGNRLNGWSKPKAFYWFNYIGNYFFRYYYSLILNEKILDTACGSKAMTKSAWQKISALRQKEGKLDKWGDIDWLYYGKRIGLRIKYADIKYTERVFGESKLQDMPTRIKFAWSLFLIGIKVLLKEK
jgi:glycosyltransferase involved in cell wall biosynthesis